MIKITRDALVARIEASNRRAFSLPANEAYHLETGAHIHPRP
jgi:hypothetical protein